MRSNEIFETCHHKYIGLRNWLQHSTGSLRSMDLEHPATAHRWRPERGKACEYVADFERIGRWRLRRPEWSGRLRLFEIYFIEGFEYQKARSAIGVPEGTFDYWYQEVKKTLGAEFSRTGLYPPSRYFGP